MNRYNFKKRYETKNQNGEKEFNFVDENEPKNERLCQCLDYFNYLVLNDLFKQSFDCWIAGGSLRDFLSGHRKFKDIDVFFPDKENLAKAIVYFENLEGSEKTFDNENVVHFKYKRVKIELVKRVHFKNLQETLETFDFTVAMCGIDRDGLMYGDSFFIDLAAKKLVINNITMPLSTLQRVQKYIWKGFSICNGGLLEISKAIQTIDLNNPGENTFEFYPDGRAKFMRFD